MEEDARELLGSQAWAWVGARDETRENRDECPDEKSISSFRRISFSTERNLPSPTLSFSLSPTHRHRGEGCERETPMSRLSSLCLPRTPYNPRDTNTKRTSPSPPRASASGAATSAIAAVCERFAEEASVSLSLWSPVCVSALRESDANASR